MRQGARSRVPHGDTARIALRRCASIANRGIGSADKPARVRDLAKAWFPPSNVILRSSGRSCATTSGLLWTSRFAEWKAT
jgi:hypothetical protein